MEISIVGHNIEAAGRYTDLRSQAESAWNQGLDRHVYHHRLPPHEVSSGRKKTPLGIT